MFSKLIKGSTFLCLSLFFCTSLFAQSITGTVTDNQSGEPLAGANVVQVGTSNGVSADANGAFSFELIEDEEQRLSVSFVGYKTKTITITDENEPLDISLTPKTIMSNEVFVKALRADEASPMSFENVSREDIERQNMGQDMPYMISSTPSVTTTSDAGAGVGYTGLRVRGVDQARINVTVNGIPMNDAESHNVFWVNMPDLASSVENIQVQRGVGTSTNGAAAFGATMNIQTSQMEPEPYGEVNTSVGSFNTRKANVQLGSGQLDNGWQFEGRLSKIDSDGYIDRSFSDLKSFYLSGAKHGENSLLRADVFSGQEQTYQAWYGISEDRLESGDRKYNPAGMEKPNSPYDNQTDNYQQDHYQLHYSYELTENWNANASLHYTYGRGYYEEYKADQSLEEYNFDPIEISNATIEESDLVRQLWLDNHFYGGVFSMQYNQVNSWSLTLGGGYNEYNGDHFGDVVWAEYAGNTEVENRYYDNNAFKTDFNSYIKAQYHITDKLSAFADAQVRHITYDFLGKDRQPNQGGGQDVVDVQQSDQLTFFNPKGGLTYSLKENQQVYASVSVGNKEPTRDEYVNSTPENRPKHETLYDWEAGYKGNFDRFFIEGNLYYMDYKNQLILTGEINDVGAYVRQNVPDSYRAGIELQAGVDISDKIEWSGNATLSQNKIEEYTFYLDNYDTGEQQAITHSDTDIAFSPSFISNSKLRFTHNSFAASLNTKYVSRQHLDNTQTESRSLDAYWVNDLQLSYSLNRAPFVNQLDATLQVNNIFDEMYESNGYTYGYIAEGDQQHFNYYYPQAGRNIMFQLSFKF